MADQKTFVIVGGGLAGAKAAGTLRSEGFDGRVVIVAAEPELPYERPPLSKSYLVGQTLLSDAHVHDHAFYDDQEIELLAGRTATELDPSGHTVALDDDTTLAYDRLLIATGAVPRRLPIEGADSDGVHLLRTVADSDRLRETILRGGRVAVIGAGWIGCEVAASARTMGADVSLIEYAHTPLQQVLGEQIGEYFSQLHRDHGVQVLTDARVTRIDDDLVVLDGQEDVVADAVVMGVGVAPATGLGERAGLQIDNGIVTDEHFRTSAPDVFAAGDVASVFNPRYDRQVRVEHWATAGDQGVAVARAMLDSGTPWTDVPFFFSDQYDLGLEYFGLHAREDRVEVRGSMDEGRFQVFWIGSDSKLTAGMHVNDWDASGPIRRLVEQAAPADEALAQAT